MKTLTAILLSFCAVAALADYPDHRKGEGRAFFPWEGAVYDRQVDLYLPKDGKSKVFAIFDGSSSEVKATHFWLTRSGARTVFNVILPEIPGGDKDLEVLLTGSYLSGKNRALYYGDFYTRKRTPAALPPCGSKHVWGRPKPPGCAPWEHGGGFQFSYKE